MKQKLLLCGLFVLLMVCVTPVVALTAVEDWEDSNRAVDDNFVYSYGSCLDFDGVLIGNVLNNDYLFSYYPTTIEITQQPILGRVEIDSNGHVYYSGLLGSHEPLFFRYRLYDGYEYSNEATGFIQVNNYFNDVITYNIPKDTLLDIAFQCDTTGFEDMCYVSPPSHGNINRTYPWSYGWYSYMPNAGFAGKEQMTYQGVRDMMARLCIGGGSIIINVGEFPHPGFTATPTSGTAPLTVQFTDTSTGSPTSWNWSFGDGSLLNATVQNPVHTYSNAGTYTVSLKAANADGSDTKTSSGYITVNPATPVSGLTGIPTSGTAPLTVQFTDVSSNIPTGWSWYFGDETYTESWTQMTTSSGWTARAGQTSVVMPDSSIVLMGGMDGSGRRNDVWRSTNNGATWTRVDMSTGWTARAGHRSVAMPDSSIVLMGGNDDNTGLLNDVWRSTNNGVTWMQVIAGAGWSARGYHSCVVMPDGSIVLMGGVDSSGRKNDVWRSTDNGATWTRVNASAGWSGRGSHSSVAMPDGSIVLMGGVDSSGSLKNDVWRSTDNGATWTQQTAAAGWSARFHQSIVTMPDGSIVLMGGQDNSGFKNDVWRSSDNGATWTQLPDAGWSARYAYSSVAMPDSSIVMMGGEGSSGFKNDVWRFVPTGSSAQNPSHTYTTPGTYQVALQAYNTGGYNSMQKTGYITVNPPAPVADFSGVPTSGTSPLTVTFTDNSTSRPTSWDWSFGDESLVNATVQNPVHTYTSHGNYTVSLNTTNAGGYNKTIKIDFIRVFAPAGDYILTLKPGWNFISTPKKLETSNDTALIFKDVDTNGHSIWLYDAPAKQWRAMNASSKINALDGIWVYSTQSIDITLGFDKNPLNTPPTKQVYAGWNPIGFSDIYPLSAKSALSSVRNDWSHVIGYDVSTQGYEVSIINGDTGIHSDSREMLPTKGYWLWMNSDGNLSAIGA